MSRGRCLYIGPQGNLWTLLDSPHLNQQRPYVVQRKGNHAFDKHGSLVPPKSREAHIPIEEFVYRGG